MTKIRLELPSEYKKQTLEERKFFTLVPFLYRCNPNTLVPELIEEGDDDLAEKIVRGVSSFVCPECKQTERVGIGYNEKHLLFFCVDCAPDHVRWSYEMEEQK